MQGKLKSLFKTICEDKLNSYPSAEEAKRAKLRNKQIDQQNIKTTSKGGVEET